MGKAPLETIHSGVAPDRLNIRSLGPRPDVHGHRIDRLFDRLAGLVVTFDSLPQLVFNEGHEKAASDAVMALGKTVVSEYTLVPRGALLTRGEVALEYQEIVQMAGDFYAKYDADDTWSYEKVAASESKLGTRLLSYEGVALSADSDKGMADTRALMKKLSTRRGDQEFGAKAEEALGDLTTAEIPWVGHVVNGLISGGSYGYSTLPDSTDGEEMAKKAKALFSSAEFSDATRRYMLLLLTNWDHFHPWCLYRYKALHERAKTLAYDAGKACRDAKSTIPKDPLSSGAASAPLKNALAMNAFADHFLTDAFSSGHLIGNRRSLRDKRVGSGTVLFTLPGGRVILRGELSSSKKSRDLHDKYSHDGEAVRSAASQYMLYGDHFFGDYSDDYEENPPPPGRFQPGRSYEQTRSMLKAQVLSIASIYQSFLEGALGTFTTQLKDATVKIKIPQIMAGTPKEEEFFLTWHEGEPLDPLGYVPHLLDKRCCSQEDALARAAFPNVSIDVPANSPR